ncbi:uncharacterized protein LOC141651657 [Silene latifolia]|uniref:uncharacterized protein LOC141651657 n=1 Tax=Silene latifolia TaxID=37657 RepID=UPI003D77F4DB
MGGMGFRNFHLFNLALLGKQAWRLVTETKSLWARVMRARYYPNDTFMTTGVGNNPSYTWRGILEARNVLEQGLRKRIGDGLSTRIWLDAWIPGTQTGRVLSPRVQGHEDMLVSELMEKNGGGWKDGLISTLFLPFERDRICNIRVNTSRPSDEWYWNVEKNGIYTVSCVVAKRVWEGMGLEGDDEDGRGGIRDWVEARWRELGGREIVKFMVGCWALWEHRNKVIFESCRVDPFSVIRRACDILDEIEGGSFLRDNKRLGEGQAPGCSEGRGWTGPPSGFVKVNVDAGVKDEVGSSMGVVCRDEWGKVLWGVSRVTEQVWEPHIAEAEALLEGVKEAIRNGHTRVVFESDCLQVIEALKKKTKGRSIFSLILEDISSLCNVFISVIWSFTSRVNSVAHSLAHIEPRVVGRSLWSVVLPPIANNAVLYDLSLMQ